MFNSKFINKSIAIKPIMLFTLLALILVLQACTDSVNLNNKDSETLRWYSNAQVTQGGKIFLKNCASCHGRAAQATPNWRVADSNGIYPPPPLNGTAHAWHHPFAMLKETIAMGTTRGMPAWKEVLTEPEIEATIAWIESHWPEPVYQAWMRRN